MQRWIYTSTPEVAAMGNLGLGLGALAFGLWVFGVGLRALQPVGLSLGHALRRWALGLCIRLWPKAQGPEAKALAKVECKGLPFKY